MDVERVPRIFISYRRDDAAGFATLLDQTLGVHFGEDNVFRDISDIGPGKVFEQAIRDEINSCDILLAVIGKDWLTITNNKLEKEEEDYVRLEIATALSRHPDIVVIPVLVQGAQVPPKKDLPEDLKGLVKHNASELSHKWWKQDSKHLIQELEKEFHKSNKTKTFPDSAADSRMPARKPDPPKARVRNSRVSFYGGSGAGLLSGAVVGVYYTYHSASESVGWWRPVLVAGYAFLVGVIISGLINYFIETVSRWRNSSPLSKLIGSTIGGTLGGVLAAILGGVAFAVVEGEVVDPKLVAAAVIFSNFVVAAGMLLPELREGWKKAIFPLFILTAVSLGTWFVVAFLLDKYKDFLEAVLSSSSPFITGVLMLGAVAGFLSGIQVGIALFVCGRDDKLEDVT